jgi:hypothetical protein
MAPGYSRRRATMSHTSSFFRVAALTCLTIVLAGASTVVADTCPEEAPLQNYTGSGTTVCPCFLAGEQAGAVLQAPAEHYPIEILRVGIGWASQFGGAPQSLEQAIHVYDAGLPNPGAPIFSLPGPVMTDGFINVFDLEPIPGEIVVDSGPFTVTLEFANANSGDIYAPSMVHDGNGCQSGKNVVFAIPGGWYDACLLGVGGDWVVQVYYRQVYCESGVDGYVVSSEPALLAPPRPNPFTVETRIEFALATEEYVNLSVYDVRGQKVAELVDEARGPGRYVAAWDGMAADGSRPASGVYFCRLEAGGSSLTRRMLLLR